MSREQSLVGPREPCAECGLDWPNTEQEKLDGQWYCGACADARRVRARARAFVANMLVSAEPYRASIEAPRHDVADQEEKPDVETLGMNPYPPIPDPPDLGSALIRLGMYLQPLGHDAAACGSMVATELARLGNQVRELEKEKTDDESFVEGFSNSLRRQEREACLAIVRAQPFYPDTHTGMRQQWVKDQIAEKICARGGG